jgi:hypothetical protein
MLNTRRVNLEELSRRWGVDPGQDTGKARIRMPNLDRSFSYTAIRSAGSRSWRFEGTQLEMALQSDTTLAVHFNDSGGALRSLLFIALPFDVEDLMVQEAARRDELFFNIYNKGPIYTSNNYGTLVFTEEGRFTWTGNYFLVPQVIPADALGSGRVSMGLFLSPSLEERYHGAMTFYFDGAGGSGPEVNFFYTLDSQGFRVEYVPAANLDGITVTRRSSSPMVIYFSPLESPAREGGFETPEPGGFVIDDFPEFQDSFPWDQASESYEPESEDEFEEILDIPSPEEFQENPD